MHRSSISVATQKMHGDRQIGYRVFNTVVSGLVTVQYI